MTPSRAAVEANLFDDGASGGAADHDAAALPAHWTRQAADAASVEVLIRCFVRECGIPVPADGPLCLDLPASDVALRVPVRYRSPTGWHAFWAPVLGNGRPASLALVAAALVAQTTASATSHGEAATAVARVLDSARRIERHLSHHHDMPDSSVEFLAAEQALLLGHPFHPTPKSRAGASDNELASWSPELRGAFALHWFAADRSVVRGDSAVSGHEAEDVVRALAGDELALPAGTVPIPAHPWQARDVRHRPGIQTLLDQGLLHDLGPGGPAWYPTSSVRTVYRPNLPWMLKLSLGMRITNSRRNNLRSELRLGVQAARLLDAGVGAALHRAYPAFRLVTDPAWVAVETSDAAESGLETAIRVNPFGPDSRVACVAGLVAGRPGTGPSRLAQLVSGLAGRFDRRPTDIAEEWFVRYLEVVAVPLLWLYASHGIGLEAHHQNTLVTLDDDGWPAGGWYRDSQGYYLADSHADGARRLLPGFGEGVAAIFTAAFVDERIAYYLGINNLLGLIGAFGSQGLADERRLLARLRQVLGRLADELRPVPGVIPLLLDAPTLRCKANYLTSVDGRDELVGSVEEQSIYVDIPNPIAEVRA